MPQTEMWRWKLVRLKLEVQMNIKSPPPSDRQ